MAENPFIGEDRLQEFRVMCPVEFDLNSGTTDVCPIFSTAGLSAAWGNRVPTCTLIIKEWRLLWTVAPLAAGADIYLGSEANFFLHDSYSTLGGRSIGDVDVIDQSNFAAEPRVFNTQNWIQVRSAGNLGAAGSVRVEVTLVRDYTQWVDFDPTA